MNKTQARHISKARCRREHKAKTLAEFEQRMKAETLKLLQQCRVM